MGPSDKSLSNIIHGSKPFFSIKSLHLYYIKISPTVLLFPHIAKIVFSFYLAQCGVFTAILVTAAMVLERFPMLKDSNDLWEDYVLIN